MRRRSATGSWCRRPDNSRPRLPRRRCESRPCRLLQGRRIVAPTATALPRASAPPARLPREALLAPLASTPIKTRPIVIDAPTPPSLTAALAAVVVTTTTAATTTATTTTEAPAPALPATPVAAPTHQRQPPPPTPLVPPQPTVAGGLSMARQLGPRRLAHRHRPRARRPRSGRRRQRHDRSGASSSTSRCGSRSCSRSVPGVEVVLTRRTDEFVPLRSARRSPTAKAPTCSSRSTPTPATNVQAARRRDLLPELRHQPERRRGRGARERRVRPGDGQRCPTSSRRSR